MLRIVCKRRRRGAKTFDVVIRETKNNKVVDKVGTYTPTSKVVSFVEKFKIKDDVLEKQIDRGAMVSSVPLRRYMAYKSGSSAGSSTDEKDERR